MIGFVTSKPIMLSNVRAEVAKWQGQSYEFEAIDQATISFSIDSTATRTSGMSK